MLTLSQAVRKRQVSVSHQRLSQVAEHTRDMQSENHDGDQSKGDGMGTWSLSMQWCRLYATSNPPVLLLSPRRDVSSE